jgi:RNA polymerase sigma-70 factor (ECF subfamily)
MELSQRARPDIVNTANSATSVARALETLSDVDLLRLRALARLRARALPPGIHWTELLQEAVARALDGSRQWPAGVPFLVFLAGVMRSLCHEILRYRRREATLIAFGDTEDEAFSGAACPAPDQERVLAASDAVAAIYRLFAGDAVALRIISGLANGLGADEIRRSHGLSTTEYDTARRRMRRALLRAGLSWSVA